MKRLRRIRGVPITKAEVLTLQPGDVLVLRLRTRALTGATLERLREQVKAQFPGHRAIVLEDGMSLSVARPLDVEVKR